MHTAESQLAVWCRPRSFLDTSSWLRGVMLKLRGSVSDLNWIRIQGSSGSGSRDLKKGKKCQIIFLFFSDFYNILSFNWLLLITCKKLQKKQIVVRNSLNPEQDPNSDFWLDPDPDSMNMDPIHCSAVWCTPQSQTPRDDAHRGAFKNFYISAEIETQLL